MEEIEKEIDRTLRTLRATIKAQDFTQLRIQEILGWGRSSISQIMTRAKGFRFESLLLILKTIDVAPGAFYAQLYGWPPSDEPESESDAEFDPTEEVDRVLAGLAQKIRARGPTQSAVQQSLGWGRSYISQLMTKQKGLRVDQVLMILWALGIEARDFFWELYRREQFEETPREERASPGMAGKLEELTVALSQVCRLLVRKGLVSEWDLPRLVRVAQYNESERPIDQRQLSFLPPGGDEDSQR